MDLNKNYLPEENRKKIFDWIHNHEYLDDDFNGKRCFAVTYKKDDLPDFLKCFIKGNFNVYNFVGFYTLRNGFIEPHIDTDLFDRIKEKDKNFMIFLPETEVYYADVCPEMQGGEIIVDEKEFKPVTNSSITLPRNTMHSVNKVLKQSRYRTTLVCEKYFLLKKYLDKLNTPWFHKG